MAHKLRQEMVVLSSRFFEAATSVKPSSVQMDWDIWYAMTTAAPIAHPVSVELLPVTTPQFICVLIAPDCLLSPVSLAKNCSIYISPNDHFVWQHFSGLAVEKLQLLIWITKRANCFMWLDLTTCLLIAAILSHGQVCQTQLNGSSRI